MNYYEHHIGDYAQATAHLSILEDGAYIRCIRKYYADEKPLPADIAAVQRLVGARSREERKAVETVVKEFFTLEEDGWHNKRCDEEIAKFHEGQPDREAKRDNERERQRRARERRKQLFDTLREAGVVPAYDAPMSELQRLASQVASRAVTPPVTRDDTATQTPDTRHQTPVEEPSGSSLVASRRRRLPDDFCPNQAGLDKAHERGLDPGAELQKFSDYHRAKGSVMADWQAAWRTWVGNARRPSEHPTLSDAGLRTAAAARAAKVMIFGRDAA